MDWTWACISTSLNSVFKNCPAFHTNDLVCAQYMFVLVYLRSNGKNEPIPIYKNLTRDGLLYIRNTILHPNNWTF